MGIEHAWLLKGWLLGQNPPEEVTQAVEAVISALSMERPGRAPSTAVPETKTPDPITKGEIPGSTGTTLISDIISPATKPRKPWSPEARAAAAERMRATQARLKEAKNTPPGEVRAPAEVGA